MPTSTKFSVNKLNQRGAVHLLVPLLLLAGIIGGVYLVTNGNPLKLFSKASNPPIVFKSAEGQALPTNSEGIPQTALPNVKIELTSTLGVPVFANPSPTPTSSPIQSPAQSPIPSPTNPINITTSCNDSNLTVSVSGDIPSPSDRNLGLWSTLTDESANQSMIFEYSGNFGPPTIQIAANFPPTGAIRGSSIPVIGDGRVYTVKVYAAAFTTGTPAFTSPIAQAAFSQNCNRSSGIGTTARTLGVGTSASTGPIQVGGTVSYKIAENPTDLDNAIAVPYTQDPMVLDYTFTDSTPGQKFIWVEFRDVAGTTDRRSAQIIISSSAVSISVFPATVVKNSDLTVKWSGLTRPLEKDWIGFFKKNDPVDARHLKHWFFIGSCSQNSQGRAAEFGSCAVTIPDSLDQGEYDLRLMANNAYDDVMGSSSVIVTDKPRGGGKPTVNVPSQAAAGSEIAILYAGLTGAVEKDWAGLFKQGDPSEARFWKEWLFLGSCSRTSGGSIPAESGSCTMRVPSNLPVGNYEIRLMIDNTYNVIAISNPIGIGTAIPSPSPIPSPTATPTLTISPSVLYSNGTLNVSWSGIQNPNINDYISINIADDQHGVTSHTYWINNNCTWSSPSSGTPKSSGSCTISLNNDRINTAVPGPYHLVLNSGATPSITTRLARSNNFDLIKRVFVTSTVYNSNLVRSDFPLTGLSGADDKCNEGAYVAKLGGNWKAWLSDSTTSAASRLTHNSGPYKLLNGTIIANNWDDLTDGSLINQINIDEFGNFASDRSVWTATTANGSNDPSDRNCKNWTFAGAVDSNPPIARHGYNFYTNANWTDYAVTACVENDPFFTKSLYCFEQ